jgi:hypothetical protein
VRWFRDIAVLLALGWLLLVALTTARAQEPTPEPTPDFLTGFCNAASIEGDGARTIGAVEITLPPGTYNIISPPPDPGDPFFILCHKESGGGLSMNAANCEENSRTVPNAEAVGVIDAIAASCRVLPTPVAQTPTPFVCAAGDTIAGGQTVTIADVIQVTLPPGEFAIQAGPYVAFICNPAEEYSVVLNLEDCARSDVPPPNSPPSSTIDDIVSSCVQLNAEASATPEVAGVTILPPDTGDAGLLVR